MLKSLQPWMRAKVTPQITCADLQLDNPRVCVCVWWCSSVRVSPRVCLERAHVPLK